MTRRNAMYTVLLAIVVAACSDANARGSASRDTTAATRAPDPVTRQYGPEVAMGNGTVRTYVAFDASGAPAEIGVALKEAALEGLPAPAKAMQHHSDGMEHVDSRVYDLELPKANNTPYRFVELDWNPGGHEPPGVYDTPHFDFHFYRVEQAVRDGIDPKLMTKDQFLDKSGKFPAKSEWTPNFVALAPPGAPVLAVPRMGTHWIDVRTPELQALFGKPEAFRPFTTTFLHGSWDGQMIFDEPMITRAFILSRKATQRDSVITLDQAEKFVPAGYYPRSYRVAYDAVAQEYIIALTQLGRKN